MLAALIATRPPPKPPVFFYTNQLAAATNTFVCLTVVRKAAFIATNQTDRRALNISLPGAESSLDHLNRLYYQIINAPSSNAQIISMPSDLYLSNLIAEVILVVTAVVPVLAVLPVPLAAAGFLSRLQLEMATALANLRALGVILN
jgi:hypothetical protein